MGVLDPLFVLELHEIIPIKRMKQKSLYGNFRIIVIIFLHYVQFHPKVWFVFGVNQVHVEVFQFYFFDH